MKVSGFITNEATGEALIGVNILLYKDSISTDSPPYRGASTNSYGFYVITKVGIGKYFLIARSIGFKPVIKDLNVTVTRGAMNLNIEMNEEEIKLKEVIVKGEKEKQDPVSAIDIAPELLEQLPSLSGEVDLLKMLQHLPGVNTASELSSGLYVRGGSPDQTLTLVDGVIMYNPAHLGNFASTFNSNAIRDIRLMKGAFPAEYGGRLSSVLDVKLRSGTKEKFKGIAGVGIINSHFTFEGPMEKNSTYILSGRTMYYDKIQQGVDQSAGIPRYNFFDINTKLNYNLSETSYLGISAMYSNDKLYSASGSEDSDYDINWKNTTLSLNWLQINTKSMFSNTNISYINYKFESKLNDKFSAVSSADYYSLTNLSDLMLKQDVEIRMHENHTTKLGFELSYHDYGLIYNDEYNILLESDPFAETEITAIEAAGYLQFESQIGSRLKTNVGGRFYYFRNRKFFKVEPRVSASFAITDNIFLKGAYAIAHQFLHLIVRNDISLPTDLWFPSTRTVNPGRSEQYVGGFDFSFDESKYVISLEGYYKDMENLHEFRDAPNMNVIDGSIEDQFVEGEGESYGAEFFFNKRAGDLTGWLGYTLSWTKRRFDDLNGGQIFTPRYDRRHDVSVVLAYRINENWNIGMTWLFASGQGFTFPTGQFVFDNIGLDDDPGLQLNYTERNEYKLPDYHKLDLNITYKFKMYELPVQVYLNIYNVYNRKNPFAHYISYKTVESGGETIRIPELKQITLFPLLPTIGFNIKF